MDLETARALSKAIVMLAALLTPIGAGMVAKATIESIARNPKLENSLFTKMIIAIALIETTVIFALVAFFII